MLWPPSKNYQRLHLRRKELLYSYADSHHCSYVVWRGVFFRTLEKTYSTGLYYNLALVGIPVGLFLSGQLVSRMREFMNNVSVAEAMGAMYGKTAQMITATSGALAKLGLIAIQFKVISRMLVLLFNLESSGASFVAAGIVILYSAFGGI